MSGHISIRAPEKHYVNKGWGFEEWICNNGKYCGKRLHMWKNKRLSWHYHKEKDETFYVASGELLLFYSEEDCLLKGTDHPALDTSVAEGIKLRQGDSFYVYPGLRHQLLATLESDIIEFSTTHFDEDSYRVIKGD